LCFRFSNRYGGANCDGKESHRRKQFVTHLFDAPTFPPSRVNIAFSTVLFDIVIERRVPPTKSYFS
jgi:hypothetical protein